MTISLNFTDTRTHLSCGLGAPSPLTHLSANCQTEQPWQETPNCLDLRATLQSLAIPNSTSCPPTPGLLHGSQTVCQGTPKQGKELAGVLPDIYLSEVNTAMPNMSQTPWKLLNGGSLKSRCETARPSFG